MLTSRCSHLIAQTYLRRRRPDIQEALKVELDLPLLPFGPASSTAVRILAMVFRASSSSIGTRGLGMDGTTSELRRTIEGQPLHLASASLNEVP